MAAKPIFEVAVERIRRIFDTHNTVSVAFSGGKDSTVLLAAALIAAEGRTVICAHNDFEATDPMTWAHLKLVGDHPQVRLRRFCFPVWRHNHCSTIEPYWSPWDSLKRDKWIWPLPEGAEPLPAGFDWHNPDYTRRPTAADLRGNAAAWPTDIWGDHQHRCELTGLRAGESVRRRQLLRADVAGGHAAAWYRPADETLDRCAVAAPLAEATQADIWHAQHHHANDLGLPENPFYAYIRGRIGLRGMKHRVHTGFDEVNVALWGGIGRDYPEWLERMLDRVEGVRTVARYGQTPLYGRGDYRGEFGDNPDWAAMITRQIDRLAEPLKSTVRRTAQTSIRAHRKTTTDPIPDFDPHPISGICWAGLHKLAMSPPPIKDEMVLLRKKNAAEWVKAKRRNAGRYGGFGGGHTRKADRETGN